MFQPDLFASQPPPAPLRPVGSALDMPGVLERLRQHCERPRYSFMVLNLIAHESARTGCAGPDIVTGGRRASVREWLCEALAPIAQRDPTRLKIADRVRRQLAERGELPVDPERAADVIEEHVRRRVRASGLTNVSRAVSELVRAGFVRRHYQGYRVDHHNRGAQRTAVYTVTNETLRALGLN